jgi:site-specific DNA recombinase
MQPPRAALYGRFSTDLQNASSAADQLRLCRRYAEAKGYAVVLEAADEAKTSASLLNRPGLDTIRSRLGDFDVLVVEALDRLSRDMGDLGTLHRELTFAGVSIETTGEGRADEMRVGIHGLMGQIWMTGHKAKVKRGVMAALERGGNPGGKCFGYKSTPQGQVIDLGEAKVIRRIFEAYASGQSAKDIVAALNAEGIPGPRSDGWNRSTLLGSKSRSSGLLRNPPYGGRRIYNRVTMHRDPRTGRRISRVNPQSEWKIVEAPELRIVPEELWQAVQARLEERSHEAPKGGRPRSEHMLSGLLRCGSCGGPMSLYGKKDGHRRVRCSRARERGTCPAPRTGNLDMVQLEVLHRLRKLIISPENIKRVRADLEAQHAGAIARRGDIERELARAERALERISRALLDESFDYETVAAQSARLKTERDRLAAELEAANAECPKVDLMQLRIRIAEIATGLHPMSVTGLVERVVIGEETEVFLAVENSGSGGGT